MAILDGADIVYIERVRSPRPGQSEIDLNLHVGSRLPGLLHLDGQGDAGRPARASRRPAGRGEFTQRGPNTITERRALEAELARVRARGLAVNNEELAYGLRSIAVPVHSAGGEVVAAINLAAHRSMVSMEDLVARLGPALQRTGREISRRMGSRSAVR